MAPIFNPFNLLSRRNSPNKKVRIGEIRVVPIEPGAQHEDKGKGGRKRSQRNAPQVQERNSSLYGYHSCDWTATATPNSNPGLSFSDAASDSSTREEDDFDASLLLTPPSSVANPVLPLELDDVEFPFPLPPSIVSRSKGDQVYGFGTLKTHLSVDDLLISWDQKHRPYRTVLAARTQVDLGQTREETVGGFGEEVSAKGTTTRFGDWVKHFPNTLNNRRRARTMSNQAEPPPIPPRAQARAPPFLISLPHQQIQRQTFSLAVDMPLPITPPEETPSPRSGSIGDRGSPSGSIDYDRPSSSLMPYTKRSMSETRSRSSLLPESNRVVSEGRRESLLPGHRRKKSEPLDKDPYKVRDGVEIRCSSSGVYTPPTFPGPSTVSLVSNQNYGLSPIASNSSVTVTTPGSSRAASMSSNTSAFSSVADQSKFSFVRGKTLEHLKRITYQVTSSYGSPTSTSNALSPVTPASASDSYFPSSDSTHSSRSRQSSWGPVTPTSTTRSIGGLPYNSSPTAGLGIGLSENEGRTGLLPEVLAKTDVSSGSIIFDESGEIVGVGQTPVALPKGKRKPVPKMLEDSLEERVEGLQMDDPVEEVRAM